MSATSRGLVLLVLLGACKGDPEDTGEPVVVSGPTLTHEPPTQAVREGDPLLLSVVAEDPDGVAGATLYHRAWGEPAWDVVELVADETTWSATLPGEEVQAPAVEYYFKARDESDLELVTYLPAGGQGDPFVVSVSVVGSPLPFSEDFEGAVGFTDLYSLGWSEHAMGFAGYTWTLREDQASSGEWAVTHRRGVDGLDPFEDWLVSPPLDLRGVDRIQLTWWERGDYADLSDHSLYLSTGSPDPDDGDFEQVAELLPPDEDSWTRTEVLELSEWAGVEAAWLAWVYRGQYADTWYIDDVDVRELGPDLHLGALSWDPVGPGESTTVRVTLDNHTDVTATGVVLTPTVDPSLGSFAGPVSAGEVAGDGSVGVDLVLTVDASHPDNAYLPIYLEAVDGSSRTWTWDSRVVVGEVSTGTLVVDLDFTGLIDASLGVGDPEAPDLEVPVVAEILARGVHSLEVDLTDHHAFLPPEPGPGRWWARVSTEYGGDLDALTIDWDGTTYTSDDLGPLPADDTALFYLPRPPRPELAGQSTDPSPVEPGDTVDLTLTLDNRGATSVGLTEALVWTDDPDVTVVDTDPFELATEGWAGGAREVLEVELLVSEDKKDSLPVRLGITVSDEVEAFEVPFDLAVPWPVLLVTGVRIDDWADGDNDGLLDPDETSNLEIELTNVGDLDSFGAVYCTLEVTGGAATATLLETDGAFSSIKVGDTKDEDDFQLEVTSGAVGDDIDLALECTDSRESYSAAFELILGEQPWLYLSATNDDRNDALDAYPFDIVNGQYRCDGSTLEILLSSSTVYDPSTLFLEIWADSTGAPYTWYQIAFQSGVGSVRGYRSGIFTSLSTPAITEVDEHTVLLTIDVTSMGLLLDTLSMGLAAGFCGGDDLYCDHFPDDWGSPWSGMYTTRWVDLSW